MDAETPESEAELLRRLREALRESEERSRAVLDASHDGLMLFESVRDPRDGDAIADFRWTYSNAAAARILGREPSWFPGRLMLETLPGNRETGLFDSYVAVVETGRPWSGEVAYARDGVDLYGRLSAAKLGDGFAVWFADLSASRRAAHALQTNERRLQAVFDQQFQFLALLAPDGTLLQINDLPLRAVGTSRESVIGRKFWDTPWWDDLPEMRAGWPARLAEAARAEGPVLSEDAYQAADGSVRVADCAITAIRDAAGEVEMFLVQASDVTERRRAEAELRESAEALRESEERYRTLFESIDDGFCVMEMLFDPDDPQRCVDYRFLEVNPTFEKQTGLANARGRTARELVPGLEQHWFETYGRVALTGEPVRFQNGSEPMGDRWFDVYAARVGDPRKRRVALLFRDISEQRRAEEALRESEARYRTLFESIDEGFCVIEVLFDADDRPVDYRFIEVNPAFEKHTGLHGATGRTIREMAPGHEQHWYDAYGRVARTGESVHFQNAAEALGRWYDVYAVRVGKPEDCRVGVVFTDISEQRRAEEALRESEERFRALADNIAQLAWMADDQGRIFWFNRRWYEYTGMSAERTAAGPSERSKVMHPDEAGRVAERFAARLGAGEVWEDTFRLRGADGRYRWFLSRAVPIRDDAGRVTRWFGTNTDVTDQREVSRREAFVAELSARLRALTDPEAIVAEALRLTGEFFGADRAGFVDVDEPGDRIVIHPDWLAPGFTGGSAAGEYPLSPFAADGVFRELAAGRSVAVTDMAGDPLLGERNRAAMEGLGVRAFLNVPLRDPDGTWIGALAVNTATPRSWSLEEVALLETVADRVRVARDGAKLQQREREVASRNARVAETLQMSLLSRPAEDAFPGMRLSTVYEAASAEAALGGDFFDAFALSEHRVALVVGDVAGKGLDAAAYTAEVKFSLRALLREHGDPARALTALNRLLIVSEVPRLVALCVAVLDTGSGALRMAAGGAEPPLLVRPGGAAAQPLPLDGGPMIGVDADVEYAAASARMAPGELLLLLTDGITEARSAGRAFFGPEGAAAAADAAAAAAAAADCGAAPGGETGRASLVNAVANAVVGAAKSFAGGVLRDDACLLVAHLTDRG